MGLGQGGQRFDKVAQEYSEDKAKGTHQVSLRSSFSLTFAAGGSLGWMIRGSMVVSR